MEFRSLAELYVLPFTIIFFASIELRLGSIYMENRSPPKAKLMNSIPQERYRLLSANASQPKEGDIVGLDQGFTSSEGEPMVLVYFTDASGSVLYEAEVYESELSS